MMQATDNQIRYLKVLISERDPEGEYDLDSLTKTDASATIQKLLSLPRKTEIKLERITSDGMYMNPSNNAEIYKVQYNKAQGDGRRLYAKRLTITKMPVYAEDGSITSPAKIGFVYVPGGLSIIKPDWKMSLEEARRFGALYGTCVRCGRTLTRESSIERSMGPICAGAFE